MVMLAVGSLVVIIIIIVVFLMIGGEPYSSLGCYTDTLTRALSTKVPGEQTINSCAQYAKTNNHKIFGMQYGNECWVDSDPNKDYKMYGKAQCATRTGYPTGSGDAFLNEIYQVN
jgi:hypothetical protein